VSPPVRYTRDQLPPTRAPEGCPVVIGWELAAALWVRHLPEPTAAVPVCRACGWRMPCPSWRFADWFLATAIPALTEDKTRELPTVRPPLPRREPGAHLQEESRFDGWFTHSG
jgi:hypothetical protein